MLIAATGHRPNKIGGYSPAAYRKLVALAEAYLRLAKPSGIISGMALGWDQAWADAGLNIGIPVHAAVPFAGQESRWPLESQKNFKRIVDQCKTVTIVCKGAYSAAKMQTRNEWMVDKADRVCALWDGSSGGTGNCVRYAESVDKQIDNVWQYLDAPTKLQAIAIKPLDIPCAALYHPQHSPTEKGICNMSIEALIQTHTAALEANTEAVKLLTLSLAGRTPSKAETGTKTNKVEDAVVKAVKETATAQELKEELETGTTEGKGEKLTGKKSEPTPYETLRALVLKLAPTNRDGIKAVSAKHGIGAPKDLLKDSSDYTSVTDQGKLEAVYADLLALEA